MESKVATNDKIVEALLAVLTELDLACMRFTHADAFMDVIEEMSAQDEKWGPMRPHPDMLWLTILTEEIGEAAKDMLEHRCPRSELVQVAAVALQWIASIDARNKPA